MEGKSKYKYSGYVKMFDEIVAEKWSNVTWAESKEKALSNLSFRYKKQHGLMPSTRIYLDPKYLVKED